MHIDERDALQHDAEVHSWIACRCQAADMELDHHPDQTASVSHVLRISVSFAYINSTHNRILSH